MFAKYVCNLGNEMNGVETMSGVKMQYSSVKAVFVLSVLCLAIFFMQTLSMAEEEKKETPANSATVVSKMILGMVYNDNVLADSTGTEDVILKAIPSINLTKEWDGYAANLSGTVGINEYLKNTTEDAIDYTVLGDVSGEIAPNLNFSLIGNYVENREHRASYDDLNGDEATTIETFSTNGNIQYQIGFFDIGLTYIHSRMNFTDVMKQGVLINQDYRDRTESDYGIKVRIMPVENIFPYIRYTNSHVNYNEEADSYNINRDSLARIIELGVEFDIRKTLLKGDISGGYFDITFDDPTLGKENYWIGNMSVLWTPLPQFSSRFVLQSNFLETTIPGSPGDFQVMVLWSSVYSVSRSWEVKPTFRYIMDDFEKVPLDDDIFALDLLTTYTFNKHFSFSLGYTFTTRDSSVSAGDYSSNVFLLSLEGHL